MKKLRRFGLAFIGAFAFAILDGVAVAQQDLYALRSGKLSPADFKGYENWKVVAVSQTDSQLKVILANDVMIRAYRRGLPASGKLFPEGSKVVKIEWSKWKNAKVRYAVQVPDKLQAIATIEKDIKRFPQTHGWAYGNFNYDVAPRTLAPQGSDSKCG